MWSTIIGLNSSKLSVVAFFLKRTPCWSCHLSRLSTLGLPREPQDSQEGFQDGSRELPKSFQKSNPLFYPKSTQYVLQNRPVLGPQIPSIIDPKQSSRASGPRWPHNDANIARDGLEMARDAPRWAKYCPK